MAWSGMRYLLLVGLFVVFIQAPGSQGLVYCDSNPAGFYSKSGFWCSSSCCGVYPNKHCCYSNSESYGTDSGKYDGDNDNDDDDGAKLGTIIGGVVGGVFALIIISVIVGLVICCVLASKSKPARGRVLRQAVTPVVVGTQSQTANVTTPGQPGIVVPSQYQTQPVPYLYPQTQPVGPPAYSAVPPPPPQYSPSVTTTQPPVQTASPS